jgi:hypothetical protein
MERKPGPEAMVPSYQKSDAPKENCPVLRNANPKTFISCREMLTTEETYLKNLTLFRDLGSNPLIALVGTPTEILTAEEISTVFSNLDQLLSVHKRSTPFISFNTQVYN